MAGNKQGAWCHIEIPTAQVEVAKKFYGTVFGWKFRDMPEMSYTLFDTGKGNVGGGLWNPPAGVPRSITNYIFVDSVDAMVARVQEHGGKLVNPKMQVPGAGWFALVADPDGNVIGLWQNAVAEAKRKRKPVVKKAGKKRKTTKAR